MLIGPKNNFGYQLVNLKHSCNDALLMREPAMLFSLLFSLFFSTPVFAKDECYELLRFPETERSLYSGDIDAAQEWLEARMGAATPLGFNDYLAQNGLSVITISDSDRKTWLGRYALAQWQRLSSLNHLQRMAALAAELRTLAPGDSRPVQVFNAQTELNNLSAINLERMLRRLDELHPIQSSEEDRAQALIQKWNLSFHLIARHSGVVARSVNPPLVSPHELSRLDLAEEDPDYYSNFVGGSRTVRFQLVATDDRRGPYNLGSFVPKTAVRLKKEFAEENGFYVPAFENIMSLMNFMGEWEPQAMTDQLRFMQFSLPSGITTVKQLRKHFTPDKIGFYFPKKDLYARGALLRGHLRNFVLNAADGETFYRAAFRRFLTVASRYEFRISDLNQVWERPGGAQQIWNGPFMEFLGFSGVSFRVPSSVPPTQYTIIRKEPHPARAPDYSGQERQMPWDSRRLDHNLKP